MNKMMTLVAAGAATLLASAAMAQTGSMGASQNNAESRQYQQKVRSDTTFRSDRERRECGPIQASDLRQQCIDSFAADSRATRSTMSGDRPGDRRSNAAMSGSASSRSGSSMSNRGASATTSSGSGDAMMRNAPVGRGSPATVPPASANAPAPRHNDGGSGR